MRCKALHLLHAYTRDIMAEFKLPKNSQIVEGDTHPEPTSAGEKKVFKIKCKIINEEIQCDSV